MNKIDQPLGYPMYVSPLTTSYLGTHRQLKNIWSGPVTLDNIRTWFLTKWLRWVFTIDGFIWVLGRGWGHRQLSSFWLEFHCGSLFSPVTETALPSVI